MLNHPAFLYEKHTSNIYLVRHTWYIYMISQLECILIFIIYYGTFATAVYVMHHVKYPRHRVFSAYS